MSSRRSSRRAASKPRPSIPPSIRAGLESLVKDNESCIQSMLSLKSSSSDDNDFTVTKLTDELENVMSMNNLSAELLLARFFDASVLSKYCMNVLSKSGKGGSATLAERIVREWGKNKLTSLSSSSSDTSSKKRKREEEQLKKKIDKGNNNDDNDDIHDDDEDWRKTLFFWRGTLEHKNGKLRFVGSWVSALAKSGVPPAEDYEETKQSNAFELTSKIKLKEVDGESVKDDKHNLIQYLLGVTGKFSGSYLLDQGDGSGPQKYTDISHNFVFHSQLHSGDDGDSSTTSTGRRSSLVVLGASGSTEFGNFVSFGYATTKTTTTEKSSASSNNNVITELILARRYVDEDDIRNSWSKDATKMLNHWNLNKGKLHLYPESKDFWKVMLPWKMNK